MRRLLARKATRLTSRSNTNNNNQNLKIKDFAPQRCGIPNDPPSVQRTIKVSKRIQLDVPDGTAAFTISPSVLAAGVPGGLTYWSKMRVENIHVWAPASPESGIAVEVLASSSQDQPSITYHDDGVQGHSRPRVGIKLGLLDRSRFFNTASTFTLVTITRDSTEPLVIQASLELTSPS